ncbi:hypothetical protein [Pseudofrankia sp. DC12]|uniref:hypothetical protein n=1 Tax=Pseudofrankia sp. DC12 TaxID=683315 RepID=UPI000697FBAA|nr:hypothetical protein [Pseudofrankia sp. DC12]
MRNPNQAGNEEQTGAVDANPPTAPHDTRGPRTKRSALASRLGPRGARSWPGEPPWAQEVAEAVLAATPTDDPVSSGPAGRVEAAEPEAEPAGPADADAPAVPDLAEDEDEDEDFAASFFWPSATGDGPARPWRSLFR